VSGLARSYQSRLEPIFVEQLGTSGVDGKALDLRVESKGLFELDVDDRPGVSLAQCLDLGSSPCQPIKNATIARNDPPPDLKNAWSDLDRDEDNQPVPNGGRYAVALPKIRCLECCLIEGHGHAVALLPDLHCLHVSLQQSMRAYIRRLR
jgi:hypothetical protein